MPEDPRPRHEYARPDTHPDFSVTATDQAADEAVDDTPPEFPEELDASVAQPQGTVSESETLARPADAEQADPDAPGANGDDEVSADTEEPDFEGMTKAELIEWIAEHKGENVSSRTPKDELVEMAKEG